MVNGFLLILFVCTSFLKKKDRLRSARITTYFWVDFQLQISFELISKSWMICLPKISYFLKNIDPRVVLFSRKGLMVLKSFTIMRNSMVHSENLPFGFRSSLRIVSWYYFWVSPSMSKNSFRFNCVFFLDPVQHFMIEQNSYTVLKLVLFQFTSWSRYI